MWSWALFLAQLRWLWNALFGRLNAAARSVVSVRGAALHAAGALNDENIRLLYARMLRHAERLGCRRPVHVTPCEFVRPMSTCAPECSSGIAAISEVYERVRYGEKSPSQDEVEAARQTVAAFEAHDPEGRGGSR